MLITQLDVSIGYKLAELAKTRMAIATSESFLCVLKMLYGRDTVVWWNSLNVLPITSKHSMMIRMQKACRLRTANLIIFTRRILFKHGILNDNSVASFAPQLNAMECPIRKWSSWEARTIAIS